MKRGWCPTVHAPMPSGDGLLVRVKPFGGRLPAAALRALAQAVAVHGNGVVELTGRGNLQIRGVRDAPAFARAMVVARLADEDPAREERRNVVALPPCDDALVAEVEAVMAATAGMTAKRFVVVDRSIWLDGVPMPTVEALRAALPGAGQPGRWSPELRPCGGALLHLPSGETDPATLARLAELVPELRTTPWRAFLSPVAIPGFEQPSGNVACAGGPACASGTVPARADAARLHAMGFTGLHVSGCAKGCAHPTPARTLVGRDGRYDLIRHGHAGDPPDLRGLTLEQAAAAP